MSENMADLVEQLNRVNDQLVFAANAEKMKAEIEREIYKGALEKAYAFIDASPGDPDITEKQIAAHSEYIDARREIKKTFELN